VICRIHEDRVLLDIRTVAEHELEPLGNAVRAALDGA
jgi:hypothetical protein